MIGGVHRRRHRVAELRLLRRAGILRVWAGLLRPRLLRYGVVAVAPAGDDGVAYCMQTYRSYDPRSGTYLGYDGLRHPCP